MLALRPDLFWPRTLQLPPEQPATVYLDMNHWIYLSKAAKGLPAGMQYREALNACRTARVNGRAVFVLAAAHYQEMTKIESPRQRHNLADLMEELSGLTTLLCRQILIKLEIEELLDHRLGQAPRIVARHDLLDTGAGRAFGKNLRFFLKNTHDGSDATETGRAILGAEAFDEMMATINLEVEGGLLRGPKDEEIPDLLRYGYVGDIAEQIAQRRADQENEQASRHAGTQWARGVKLSDVILAREVAIELLDPLLEALQRRGHSDIGVLVSRKADARALIQSMPISSVAALLKTEQHRNPSRPWKSNDIFDIDALSIAVPYCDIVVTEKNRWHHLRTAKVDEQMNTVILRRLDDLIPLL